MSASVNRTISWVDALLVLGAVALVSMREPLADHPVLFGVGAALFVGMFVHRIFEWSEGYEAAGETVREQPRHSARAA